jgi:hypothetical protein
MEIAFFVGKIVLALYLFLFCVAFLLADFTKVN